MNLICSRALLFALPLNRLHPPPVPTPPLQMRSKRNFCIDIILVCIVLGIIAYIVSMVQKNKKA